MNNFQIFTKRILDIALFIILFIPSVFLISLFSIILLFQFKSNPFFIQERGLTLTKHRLRILKLRTLKEDTTSVKVENDIFFKPILQNQITPFAAWLRKTGLDELPQIFNVFTGTMSFIGPRPLMNQDLEIMKKENPILYYKRESIEAKPGISGLWQIYGNREEGLMNLLALDLIYDTYRTINIDFQLMLKTVFFVVTSKNSDAIFTINKKDKKVVDIAISEKLKLKIDSDLVKLFALPLLKSSKKFSYSLDLPQNFWTTDYSIKQFSRETKNESNDNRLTA